MKTQEWIQRIQKIIIFAKCMERKRETWGGVYSIFKYPISGILNDNLRTSNCEIGQAKRIPSNDKS